MIFTCIVRVQYRERKNSADNRVTLFEVAGRECNIERSAAIFRCSSLLLSSEESYARITHFYRSSKKKSNNNNNKFSLLVTSNLVIQRFSAIALEPKSSAALHTCPRRRLYICCRLHNAALRAYLSLRILCSTTDATPSDSKSTYKLIPAL